MINWAKGTKEEHELASKIAKRAVKEGVTGSVAHISMDIIATHTHGCKLRLQELLESKGSDFLHDVCGIGAQINYDTGQLANCFLPRYAV